MQTTPVLPRPIRKASSSASSTARRLRHGLRASELVDLRWDQIDFNTATLAVRRAFLFGLWIGLGKRFIRQRLLIGGMLI